MYSLLEQHKDGSWWYHPGCTFDTPEEVEECFKDLFKRHPDRPHKCFEHSEPMFQEFATCTTDFKVFHLAGVIHWPKSKERREFEKACDEHIERHGRTARVYLSGRMSGLPRDTWRWRFATIQIALEHLKWPVVNPADTIIARHPWLYRIVGYRFTLWYDLRLLRKCDRIYMVGDDWQQSRGARLERMKARQWNIKELK